jgi:Zn-dependent peptidase ImmA (M78 family)
MASSILELERQRRPDAGDVELIETIAQSIVDELVLEAPIDERIVASYQGIDRIDVVDIPWSGVLFTDNNSPRIQVAASDGRRRRRFTCFHETGHTFLPGFRLTTQFRCSTGRNRDAAEILSDAGASALMFPRRSFRADLKAAVISPEAVTWLSARYDASMEATMRRIVDYSSSPSVMVVFEKGCRPSQGAGEDPKLRVQYAHASGRWPFIPRHKSVSDRGPIVEALAAGRAAGRVDGLDGLVSAPAAWVSALDGSYVDRSGTLHERVVAIFESDRSGEGSSGG